MKCARVMVGVVLMMISFADGVFTSAESMAAGGGELTADAEILVDEAGRLVVVLDRAGVGEPGRADEVVVYQARSPLPPIPRRHVQGAHVAARWRDSDARFELHAGGMPALEVLLEVDQGGAGERRALTSRSIALSGGAALVRVGAAGLRNGDGDAPRLIDFESAPWNPVRTADGLLAGDKNNCASGGVGATNCSANCKGAIAGVEIGETCSVSCGSGFYACCRCTGTFKAKAECQCLPGKSAAGSWFEAEER